MAFRQSVFDNLTGDLEYHPKRAVVYLGIGIAGLCVWIFAESASKFSPIPLVFGAGSLALLFKGVLLLRKASDGLKLSRVVISISAPDEGSRSRPQISKKFPSVPALSAQMIQDFGAGGILLGPILHVGNTISDSWKPLPSLLVFITGAILFLIGWLVRRLFAPSSQT